MKKTLLLLAILMLTASMPLQATPILPQAAQSIAKQYLAKALDRTNAPALSLCRTLLDANGTPTVYIYNVGTEGFLLVSADDLADPVLGYSFNGSYDATRSAGNFEQMLQSYSAAIASMRQAVANGQRIAASPRTVAERAALDGADNGVYAANARKDVNALVETQWGQGDGYNEYCPVYNGSSDGHALVGCVALAMAQVVRYHQYPEVGYGTASYVHNVYGSLSVNFDSTTFVYANMPNTVSWGAGQDDINAVSKLCYFCGVSVNMDYQNAGNTDGSGAHTEDIVNALRHFGYFGAYYKARSGDATSKAQFDSLVLNDLNHQMPVICSGRTSEYGHAYVCDGYQSRTNRYHFNWGWDGWQDGYYSMDDMNGFNSGQGAVLNIRPSGFGAGFDTLYVDSAATGNGSSWQHANSNLQDAIELASFANKGPVMVKAGTYYGDTTADNAFTMRAGVAVYGGFGNNGKAGNPVSPTVLSGRGERRVLYCGNFSSTTRLSDLTFADGLADKGAGALVQNNVIMNRCAAVRNVCTGTKGAGIYSTGGATLTNNVVSNNTGGTAMYIEENDNIKNCLIANNDGNGLQVEGKNLIINCDVVGNSGTGIIPSKTATIRNSIVWNNGLSIGDSCFIAFCAVSYTAGSNAKMDSLLLKNSNILLDNTAPLSTIQESLFISPSPTRGIDNGSHDWHLAAASPCIDAGDTISRGTYRYDMDGNARVRNGRTDIGCYENQNVGIMVPHATTFSAWPNPAGDQLTVRVAQPTMLNLYNAMGQLLLSRHVDGDAVLSLQGLPKGIYLLRTSNNETMKIVKQ